jgi:hypothetical protein
MIAKLKELMRHYKGIAWLSFSAIGIIDKKNGRKQAERKYNNIPFDCHAIVCTIGNKYDYSIVSLKPCDNKSVLLNDDDFNNEDGFDEDLWISGLKHGLYEADYCLKWERKYSRFSFSKDFVSESEVNVYCGEYGEDLYSFYVQMFDIEVIDVKIKPITPWIPQE